MKKKIWIAIGVVAVIIVVSVVSLFLIQKDLDQAKTIAYDKVNDDKAELVEENTEKELFFNEYEFTFASDTYRYEVKVDGFGNVKSFEKEAVSSTSPQNTDNNSSTQQNAQANSTTQDDIGMQKAQEIALSNHANGVITDSDKDHEATGIVYEIEVTEGNTEYDYVIDAATGNILQTKQDYVD